MALDFKIGPAVIRLTSEFSLEPGLTELYQPFRYRGGEPPVLTLFIRRGPPPSFTGSRQRTVEAELEGSWRLYRSDDSCELEILEQRAFRPRAVARIKESWEEVDFYRTPSFPVEKEPLTRAVAEILEPFAPWWVARWAASKRRGLILHGSAVAWDGRGLAFIGPSGAGKTTIARLFLEETKAEILNDERIFLWRHESGWRVSGTPWAGMLRKASSLSVPLARIFFLKKGPQNQIASLPPLSVATRLVSESFLPLWDRDGMEGVSELSGKISGEVPCAEFEFLKDISAIHYLDEAVTVLR